MPPSNPGGLTVMGIRELQVEWEAAVPECPATSYELLVDGLVEEITTATAKWIIKEPGVYRVAVRARNGEGASKAELATVTHVLQDLVPPRGVRVGYRVGNGQLVAVIRWKNSMVFSPSDYTLKGYYLNLHNQELDKTTTTQTDADFEDHYEIIPNIEETSIDVNFTARMGWETEFSLQTFYSGDTSSRTRSRLLFSRKTKRWFLNRCNKRPC